MGGDMASCSQGQRYSLASQKGLSFDGLAGLNGLCGTSNKNTWTAILLQIEDEDHPVLCLHQQPHVDRQSVTAGQASRRRSSRYLAPSTLLGRRFPEPAAVSLFRNPREDFSAGEVSSVLSRTRAPASPSLPDPASARSSTGPTFHEARLPGFFCTWLPLLTYDGLYFYHWEEKTNNQSLSMCSTPARSL